MSIPRYITVNVSREDILTGEQRNGKRCPIRNALKRLGYSRVTVENNEVRLSDPEAGIRYFWTYPPDAYKWLVRFDRGEEVEPFTFKLDLHKADYRPMIRSGENGVAVIPSTRKDTKVYKRNSNRAGIRPFENWDLAEQS